VVICVDALRADHVGASGYERDTTPTIDRLAKDGVVFARAISSSNWTVPAVASLFTSRYAAEHGASLSGPIRHLDERQPRPLDETVDTLAGLLAAAGLRTALFSANPYLRGLARGFGRAEHTSDDAAQLTDRVLAWLAEDPFQPFFLHLQYMDIHQPIEPPPAFVSLFRGSVSGQPGPEHTRWRFGRLTDPEDSSFVVYRSHKIALYDGALRFIDTHIGRLVARLSDLGVLGDTLIVVTSDHGEEFWDHAEEERRSADDPRQIWGIGHGHSMFQELIRVPLVFHGPGVASGVRAPCGVGLVDVAPTILDLVGLPVAPGMRGVTLRRFLAVGSSGPYPPCRPIVAESPAYGPDSAAVVWGGMKLVRRGGQPDRLYDLGADSEERTNVAAAQPVLTGVLGRALNEFLNYGGLSGDSGEMQFEPDIRDQLRNLGYLR
jgi:arylsulfatase A-like enzyme